MDFSTILKVVSDKTRLRIMHLIDRRGPELCVCDLVASLKLPQGTVSRQLMLLRHLGLVEDRRDGKWNHYSLAAPKDATRSAIIGCLRACWANAEKPYHGDLARFDDLHAKNKIVRCNGTSRAALALAGKKTAARRATK